MICYVGIDDMAKFKDLTGCQFGKLIVLEYDHTNKYGRSCWKVLCDCKKEKIVTGRALLSGDTRSCGCLQKEAAHNLVFKDLTNQKFGRLLVLKHIGQNKHKQSMWECICDCGNKTITKSSSLLGGLKNSCGCLSKEHMRKLGQNNFKDLTGERFGYLKVIECAGRKRISKNSTTAIWKCRCDCGNIAIIKSGLLLNGDTKSCGCYRHKSENNSNWQGGISFEPYCPKWNDDLRERIRAFFEYRCMICGKKQEENISKNGNIRLLSCHHVDYNKQACCDGFPVRFSATCMKCHAKTNFDKDRWMNIFHRIIEEIYNDRSYYTKEEYGRILNGV
jgi:hypothetical protein